MINAADVAFPANCRQFPVSAWLLVHCWGSVSLPGGTRHDSAVMFPWISISPVIPPSSGVHASYWHVSQLLWCSRNAATFKRLQPTILQRWGFNILKLLFPAIILITEWEEFLFTTTRIPYGIFCCNQFVKSLKLNENEIMRNITFRIAEYANN